MSRIRKVVLLYPVKPKAKKENAELHEKPDQAGEYLPDRHRKPGEIHFAEKLGIFREGIRCLVHALGEKAPNHQSAHIEKEVGNVSGRRAYIRSRPEPAKYKTEDKCR
jgi:hypothetical protein